MKLGKIIRAVYDSATDSTSKFGKLGRWMFPFNSQYLIRDAWRKYGKSYFAPSNSAGAVSSYGSDIYGPTGSIIGRY